MTNPYAPPPIVTREERKFRLEPTIRASGNSMKIGMLCGAAGGVLLEVGLLFTPRPPIEWLMAAPGLIFGLGILYAAWRAVPHGQKIKLALFPLFALASFFIIGMMYNTATFSPRTNPFLLWLSVSWLTVPGVLVLGLGCLLVARPRSNLRFVIVLIAIALIVGGAPVLTEVIVQRQSRIVPIYFAAMFLSQTAMFALIGWIFGDTISARSKEAGASDRPPRN